MKNLILITSMFISMTCFSQEIIVKTDSLRIDTSAYQYRISFLQVTTTWSSKTIESDMCDLFKSQVVFNEQLKQYVFTSKIDVDRLEMLKTFSNYEITYFKKIPIITTN